MANYKPSLFVISCALLAAGVRPAKGAAGQVPVDHVNSLLGSDLQPLLLDVRQPKEYTGELGHIAGSTLIPLKELPASAGDLDASREIVCICRTGDLRDMMIRVPSRSFSLKHAVG